MGILNSTKNLLKTVAKNSLPGMVTTALSKGKELLEKKGYESEGRKIGLPQSLEEQKKLQERKRIIKEAGDKAVDKFKDAEEDYNLVKKYHGGSSFMKSTTDKDLIDAKQKMIRSNQEAFKKSYNFGNGERNR